jgi:spoIIIJ-associated protein
VNSAVGTGPTLEDAVLAALNVLGARPDQVTLKKLEDGGTGGLMGAVARPFRVRATWRPEFAPPPPPPPAPKPERPEPVYEERPRRERGDRERGPRGARPEGRRERPERSPRPDRPRRPSTPLDPSERFVVDEEFLAKVKQDAEWLIEKLGFEATVEVAHEEDEVTVSLKSEVDDALLTGRRGDTRLSIQHVLSRLVNPRRGPGAHLLVDVNGYWAERKDSLLSRARALAAEAIASGDEATTEPLSAEERRVVHRALTADGTVTTESFGDGALKRISIRPAVQG